MAFQIVARPVSTPHNLDPALHGTSIYFEQKVQYVDYVITREEAWKRTYIGGFGFSVPAVAGVVSHLVVHVLSETQLVFGDTNFRKVEVDPPDKISQDGVIDHSLHVTEHKNQNSNFEGENSVIRNSSSTKKKLEIPSESTNHL